LRRKDHTAEVGEKMIETTDASTGLYFKNGVMGTIEPKYDKTSEIRHQVSGGL
jgi:hypothetical protein